jgi:hypothetical protein
MFSKSDFSLSVDYELRKSSSKKNGIASLEGVLATQKKDSVGEILIIKGLNIDPLKTGYAHINWWHLGKKNPACVVGFIDNAEKVKNDTEVIFEGHILNTSSGQAVLELMTAMESEGKKMGVSIEGSIYLKDKDGRIYQSEANAAALATDQVNKDCFAELKKAISGHIPDLLKTISVETSATPLITSNLGLIKRTSEPYVLKLQNDYPFIDLEYIKYLFFYTLKQIHNEKR